VRLSHTQVLPPPLELMKLQSHPLRSGPQYGRTRHGSFPAMWEVCRQRSPNQ
jgi:hypothetical protein